MDLNATKRLFEEGATLILLEVPAGTELGMDMKIWSTGINFKGIKMIPPGVHFIHYSAVNRTHDVAPRTGFFYNFKKRDIVVRKWDKGSENFNFNPISDEEFTSIRTNKLNFFRFLKPYSYDIWKRWTSLTSHISDEVIDKLMPECGCVASALELFPCSNSIVNEVCDPEPHCSWYEDPEENLLPKLAAREGTKINFSNFPKRHYPDGATAAEITQYSLDSSYVLSTILAQYSKPVNIIGEIEFTFICFLIGHSIEAFEQWKKLVCLLCSCDAAIVEHPSVYDVFISLLEIQITEIPHEFLADIVTNNNMVYLKIKNLCRILQDCNAGGRFKTKMERFTQKLMNLYGWSFSDLDVEDEAPVVVELDV